ncbi:uncharacterized protein PV09_07291 [Verruconis gallopava]|uniref:Phytase-like domain-containing protein n=1 Tax=Verruconis gallopava TaxID=253628 RepID=A0A0D2AQ05_9PEZI|nr:uncharacterized protein PV09_07291 [Verruconis gallopava]KIW01249.1 hypothetical protein PV09_07291 [Verruconis gallopava]
MKASTQALLATLSFAPCALGAACRIRTTVLGSWSGDEYTPSSSPGATVPATWSSVNPDNAQSYPWGPSSGSISRNGYSGKPSETHSSKQLPSKSSVQPYWSSLAAVSSDSVSAAHTGSASSWAYISRSPAPESSKISYGSSVPAGIPSSSRSVVTSRAVSSSQAYSTSSASPSRSVPSSSTSSVPPVFSTSCNGKTYIYNELAGYGVLPGDSRDSFGDTLGGFGSAIAIDRKSWTKVGDSYTFTLYALPDRGWNTEGTLNFQSRVHKFQMTFTPAPGATVDNPSAPNLVFKYVDTLLLTGPDGVPTTGLNADELDYETIDGFPIMPVATYTGDGFGGSGPGGRRISVDAEGLHLGSDGSFWVSDEYGPYIYQFDASGKMLQAIAPPPAIVPERNGSISFTTDDAFIYDQDFTIEPDDPDQGRENNQGFEGFTADPSGKNIWALVQSACSQEGGTHKADRRYTRLVQYDVSATPRLVGEWVVPLPLYNDSGSTLVAAQSEIHYISDTQFLILSRDKNHGHGQDDSTSIYRHADVFDISAATNIVGVYDAVDGQIATSKGVLNASITPAEYCSFIDYNINAQLNRFGVHNGGDQNSTLLNEKWESLALMPAEGEDEYYLFSLSDNDFITQNGFMNFGRFPYADSSGYNLDNQALVFKVTLPKGSSPLVS